MLDLKFLDLLTFFCKAVPALLLALALWSLAIGFVVLFFGVIVVTAG